MSGAASRRSSSSSGLRSFGNHYSKVPEARVYDCVHAAPKESVGNWPLANIISDALGGTPVYRYPSSGVTGDRKPPLETDMLKLDGRFTATNRSLADFALGNSVVAIGWRAEI